MAGTPTRTQPSRPNKRKADDPPAHCRKCGTSHSPYQGCDFSFGKACVSNTSASETETDEDEVAAGEDEVMELREEHSCTCEGCQPHTTQAECEREQTQKNHAEVGFW
jgi:hypothetical protein